MTPLMVLELATRLFDLAIRNLRLGRETVTDEEVAEAFLRGHESDERMRRLLQLIEQRRIGGG